MDLHRRIDDASERLGGRKFSHRRFQRAPLAAHQCLDAAIRQQTRRITLHRHVRQHPLQALILGQLVSALRAQLHVLGAFCNELVHHADTARGQGNATLGQRFHRLHKTHAFRPEHIFGRHLAIDKRHRRRVATAHAHLQFIGANRQALEATLDDKGRDAFDAF